MPTNRNIIIKVTNECIWFNDVQKLELHNTNLPVGTFRFVDTRPIFWMAEMLSYDKVEALLRVRIINYKPEYVDDFLQQQPKASIRAIHFCELYWPAFGSELSFYKKTLFLPLLSESMPVTNKDIATIHIKANIAFGKIRFGAGVAAFDYVFNWNKEKHEIIIRNPHLIPEFEYVKSYFAKHFNSRTFEVLMVITKIGNKTDRIIASSKQIEQIRDVAIDTLKFVRLQNLKKPPKYIKEIDKSLFTREDIFDPFDKNSLGTNPLSERELFEHIMSWEDIRNKRQLEYLSGHLHTVSEKIRFTLTPKFGFLFVVHGEQMVHYIWEMLNTNATYMWSFTIEDWKIQKPLDKLEEIISYIRNHGRDSYLRNVSPSDDVLFRRILHQGAGSALVDHFPRWRHSINESIV